MSLAAPLAIERTVPVTLPGVGPTALTTAVAENVPCRTTAPRAASQPPMTLFVLEPGATANTSTGVPASANVTGVQVIAAMLLDRKPLGAVESSVRYTVTGPSGCGTMARPCRLVIMLPAVVPLLLV